MSKNENPQAINLERRTEDRRRLQLIREIPRVHVLRNQAVLDLYLTGETSIEVLLNWLTQCRWSIFHELSDGQETVIVDQDSSGGLSCEYRDHGHRGSIYFLRMQMIGLPSEQGRRITMEERFRLVLTTPTGLTKTFRNRPMSTQKQKGSRRTVRVRPPQTRLRVIR